MRVNPRLLISLVAAAAAAAAPVLSPVDAAAPAPLGGICVMTGPRTTWRAPGIVEIHTVSPSVVDLPYDNWPLLGGGPRSPGHR